MKGASLCRSFSDGGRVITRDADVAESFCDYYAKVGPDLAGKVRPPASGSYFDNFGPRSGPPAFFFPITPAEIKSSCQALAGTKGPGQDDLSPAALRFAASELSAPLSRLVNTCLEAGHFLVRVTPIVKMVTHLNLVTIGQFWCCLPFLRSLKRSFRCDYSHFLKNRVLFYEASMVFGMATPHGP